MKLSKVIAIACSLVFGANSSEAKAIRIMNDTDQTVTMMSVAPSPGHGSKQKNKSDLQVGLAAKVRQGNKPNADNESPDKGKQVEVLVDALESEDCFRDVTFELGNGRRVGATNLNICNTDAIIVEDAPNEIPPSAVIEPQ